MHFDVSENEHCFAAQELLGAYPHLLSAKEKDFCVQVRAHAGWLTDPQAEWLASIRERCQRESVR